jgi:hypothetical protein
MVDSDANIKYHVKNSGPYKNYLRRIINVAPERGSLGMVETLLSRGAVLTRTYLLCSCEWKREISHFTYKHHCGANAPYFRVID